jgi:hypothetical protein
MRFLLENPSIRPHKNYIQNEWPFTNFVIQIMPQLWFPASGPLIHQSYHRLAEGDKLVSIHSISYNSVIPR